MRQRQVQSLAGYKSNAFMLMQIQTICALCLLLAQVWRGAAGMDFNETASAGTEIGSGAESNVSIVETATPAVESSYAATAAARSKSQPDLDLDSNAAISASEILPGHQLANNTHKVAQNNRKQETSTDFAAPDCGQPGGGADNHRLLSQALGSGRQIGGASDEHDDITGQLVYSQREQQQSTSRYLLQSLVLGLLGMVSFSLIIIYSLKFCLCRRRKRHWLAQNSRRRRSVSDSSHNQSERIAQELLLAECSCFGLPAGAGMATIAAPLVPPLSAGLHHDGPAHIEPTPPARLQSLLAPALWGSSIYQANGDAAGYLANNQGSIYHQLERMQHQCQQSLKAWSQLNRPPAYSDIYGARDRVHQQHSANSLDARRLVSSQVPLTEECFAGTSDGDNQQNGRPEEAAESPGQPRAERQRNLLVKLNLNKTKLLSAGDLMLLSKLIDVPIVVQESQSQLDRANGRDQSLVVRASGRLDEAEEASTSFTCSNSADTNCQLSGGEEDGAASLSIGGRGSTTTTTTASTNAESRVGPLESRDKTRRIAEGQL